ncbi:MAG: hypothetical protein E7459_10535 [Ruminococcaceae bacterium]|nr:hypothetical protein [Oscillospiraceae bacterium]
MGTSLSSIHIFGDRSPVGCGSSFRSYSPNWLTFVDDLSEKGPDHADLVARNISKQIDAPVLLFGVFDSEMIWFTFFRNGKMASRYTDEQFISNKRLYDIPAMVGYEEGYKKRLSTILTCADTERKIDMLEEFFGVCLRYFPELSEGAEMLHVQRGDVLYKAYWEEEKKLTGKVAPMALSLLAEYPGKLFTDYFGGFKTTKDHYFLYGYAAEGSTPNSKALTPVHFDGRSLTATDAETYAQGRIPCRYGDARFQYQYGTPCKVTFSDDCPPTFCGKTMTLPGGCFPLEFLPSGELLLVGQHRILVVDDTLKVVARLSIKGDVADVLDNYILTASGGSFYAYLYEPNAKIYIYEIIKK